MKCTVHFSTPYKPFPNHKDGNSNFDLLVGAAGRRFESCLPRQFTWQGGVGELLRGVSAP